MRAVVFDGQLRFVESYQMRAGKPGEVAVDVIKAGICETDIQLCQGYMGFSGVLGHEFVGIARNGKFAGQRVVGEINCACEACELCRRQLGNHCPNRTVVGILQHDGAFADSVWIPEVNLHRVPDALSTEAAVFVEPVAAACRIPQQIPDIKGQSVVVLGDGRLGNLCAQVLTHHGCSVTVVGKHLEKLRLLSNRGIATVLLQDFSPARSADVVVDCTGSASGLETALKAVRPCGTIVLKTTVAATQNIHMAPFVIDEIRLLGSRCGPFADAIQLLTEGAVDVAPLLSATYPIRDAIRAFEHATRKDTLKVLLDL
ncbi:MAG: alcohol dehydrogenase catalytic domain-containing protein [Planctomycetaceae bacterium]